MCRQQTDKKQKNIFRLRIGCGDKLLNLIAFYRLWSILFLAVSKCSSPLICFSSSYDIDLLELDSVGRRQSIS